MRNFLTKIFFVFFILFSLIPSTKAVSVNELRTQQEEIKQQIDDLNSLVEQKKSEAVNLENQVAIFDAKISQLELQILETQLEIDSLQVQIDELTNEIALKQRMLDYQKEVLDESLQILYERREQNLLMILLSSDNFSDFVDQVTYIETVKDEARKTIIEINRIKTSLESQRGELNNDKSDLEDLRSRREEEQNALESQKNSKQQLLDETKGEEEEFQRQLEAAMAEEKQIETEIDKQIEEAKRKLQEQYPNLEVDGEGFNYPLAGTNRISVIGGDYMDPYYGFGFPHTGVDLYAPQSTPVYAASSGVVVVAYDSGGAGLSYIAIQHGNGYLTKYLHMSEIFVTSGQYVAMGEAIGLSGGAPGTRGAGYFTTGPHLHFEINDANGYSVNPHNFLYIEPAY